MNHFLDADVIPSGQSHISDTFQSICAELHQVPLTYILVVDLLEVDETALLSSGLQSNGRDRQAGR